MQVNFFPKKMDRIHQKEIKTQKFNKTLNFLYGDNWLRWAWLSVITRVIVLANLHFCDFFLFFNWKKFCVFFPRQIYLLTARVVRSRKKASSRFFFVLNQKIIWKGLLRWSLHSTCLVGGACVIFFFYFSGAPLVQHKYSILASLFLLDFFGWLNKKEKNFN